MMRTILFITIYLLAQAVSDETEECKDVYSGQCYYNFYRCNYSEIVGRRCRKTCGLCGNCSEKANKETKLHGACCDVLKSGGTISLDRFTRYGSCDDYVEYEKYVRDACPDTCKE